MKPDDVLLDEPCPACGGALVVTYRFKAKPIGTYSIAGSQPKLVGTYWPWVVCSSCGIEAEGEVDR